MRKRNKSTVFEGRHKRLKPPRCSFCSKTERKVVRLFLGSDGAICSECVELCSNILSEEKVTATSEGWQSWGSTIVTPEISEFEKQTKTFVGWTDKKVLKTFGLPDQAEKDFVDLRDSSGKVVWKADNSLLYLTLLPRVVVCFTLVGGKVSRVMYLPKWKVCPPDKAAKLGNWYAPPSRQPKLQKDQ